MFISKSNVLSSRTPSILDGASSDVPSNISNPDFSLNYTASEARIQCQYGNVGTINYVAVCASNWSGAGRITVRNGTSDSVRGEYFGTRDHVCMFVFESETFTDLRIVVDSESGAKLPTISYIAAGTAYQVPNGGETANYSRNWLTRNYMQRTQGNDQAAPITNLIRRMPLKGSLSLPNMTNSFVRGDWQDFLDFAIDSPFFICEQENIVSYTATSGYNPQASYICYNTQFPAPRAHSQTRALEDASIKFECFNGL